MSDDQQQTPGILSGVQSVALGSAVSVPIPPQPLKPGQKPTSVMICIPSGRAWEARTATCVAGMSTFSALNGIQIGICNLEGSMITKQRNDLVQMAMNQNADYMMWVDSDLTFKPDSLVRLLRHNKDIVGATYNKRVPPYETLGRLLREPDLKNPGMEEAENLPGGFMLIKMSVYRRLRWPWYYESYQWPGENGIEALKNFFRDNYNTPADEAALAGLTTSSIAPWINEVHQRESQAQWSYMSEDLGFCRKARKAGLQIWVDLAMSTELRHLGTLEVAIRMPEPDAASPLVAASM